jgi:hypothetical protein
MLSGDALLVKEWEKFQKAPFLLGKLIKKDVENLFAKKIENLYFVQVSQQPCDTC